MSTIPPISAAATPAQSVGPMWTRSGVWLLVKQHNSANRPQAGHLSKWLVLHTSFCKLHTAMARRRRFCLPAPAHPASGRARSHHTDGDDRHHDEDEHLTRADLDLVEVPDTTRP